MTYDHRNAQIMSLLDEGKTYAEIAQYLGISRSTVAGVVSRNRTHPPKHQPRLYVSDGKTQGTTAEMAMKYGLTRTGAYHRAKNGTKGWRFVEASE